MAAKKPMDHLRKEIPESDGPFAVLPLHGRNGTVTVEILPPLDWAFDVEDLIQSGRFGAVFDGIMDEDNAAKARGVRPSVAQAVEFLEVLKDDDGSSLGESQAS